MLFAKIITMYLDSVMKNKAAFVFVFQRRRHINTKCLKFVHGSMKKRARNNDFMPYFQKLCPSYNLPPTNLKQKRKKMLGHSTSPFNFYQILFYEISKLFGAF